MTEHTIGIDISKSHLDAFRLEDQAARQFENSPRGIRALIRWLDKTPVARIVFEPTGAYHRALETALSGKLPLIKVNPLQARRFAQACGTRAKTDAVDARILAQMGVALKLEPDVSISENLEGSVRSRGETATALTVRDLIEAGLNKPAGSQALWG